MRLFTSNFLSYLNFLIIFNSIGFLVILFMSLLLFFSKLKIAHLEIWDVTTSVFYD